MAADQTLEFLKFGNFTCRCSLKGRYATFCQSLCRSVEPFWRFSHFTILQNGGHLGFLKLQNFTCQSSSEGQCASPCQIWCRSVKLLRIWPFFSIFPRWRPSAILFYACLDYPRRVFGGLCHCAKFAWNRCNSFHNMQVIIFCNRTTGVASVQAEKLRKNVKNF